MLGCVRPCFLFCCASLGDARRFNWRSWERTRTVKVAHQKLFVWPQFWEVVPPCEISTKFHVVRKKQAKLDRKKLTAEIFLCGRGFTTLKMIIDSVVKRLWRNLFPPSPFYAWGHLKVAPQETEISVKTKFTHEKQAKKATKKWVNMGQTHYLIRLSATF